MNAQTIDAVASWNDVTYFVMGNQVKIYDYQANKVTKVVALSEAFKGITFQKIDAMVAYPDKAKVYFFSGNEYSRLDMLTGKIDNGYPKNMSGWNGVMDKVEPNDLKQKTNTKEIAFFAGTWAEALAEAKKTNKLIFVDAYTTWCGPCKYMDANVFTDAKVGTYFNANFINFKMDMESAAGKTFAKQFPVQAYPTFLYINSQSKVVLQESGSRGVSELLEQAARANENKNNTNQTTNTAKGISFFEGTWEEALAEAKATGKPIFVDAYTTWCGPCKHLSKNVFTDQKVGLCFNKKFINFKMNMETEQGKAFGKKYPVGAYPTLYFLDKNGDVLKKQVGAGGADWLVDVGTAI